MNEEALTYNLDQQIFEAPSSERYSVLRMGIANGQATGSSFSENHAHLDPKALEELRPEQRFCVMRNPWALVPTTTLEALEQIEALLRYDLLDQRDVKQAEVLVAELTRRLDSETRSVTIESKTTAIDIHALWDDLSNTSIEVTDNEATKAIIKERKAAGSTTENAPLPTQKSYHTLSEIIDHEAVQKTESTLAIAEEQDISILQKIIDSHSENANAQRTLLRNTPEDPESTFRQDTARRLLGIISNSVVLNYYIQNGYTQTIDKTQYDETLKELLAADDYSEDFIRLSWDIDILRAQSINSIESQMNDAHKKRSAAESELEKYSSLAREVIRADIRKNPDMGEKLLGVTLDQYILDKQSTAMRAEIERGVESGELICPDRNYVLKKIYPRGISRNNFETMWPEGYTFAEAVEATYCISGDTNPEIGHAWNILRTLLQESKHFKGIDLKAILEEVQEPLINEYINKATEAVSHGHVVQMGARIEIDNEYRRKAERFISLLIEVAQSHQRILMKDELIEYTARYFSVYSNFIVPIIHGGMFDRALAQEFITPGTIDYLALKCARWISPEGIHGIVPTTGDFNTTDNNGNPVTRSGHTELANQGTFLGLKKAIGIENPNLIIIADTDIEGAMGYPSNSLLRTATIHYLLDLERSSALQEGQMTPVLLSQELTRYPEYKEIFQHHFTTISAIVRDMSGKPPYFNSPQHLERLIDDIHQRHAMLKPQNGWEWTRANAGSDRINEPGPSRYVVYKIAEYLSWITCLQLDALRTGRTPVLVIGGMDVIGTFIDTYQSWQQKTLTQTRTRMGLKQGKIYTGEVIPIPGFALDVRTSLPIIPVVRVAHFSDYH